MLGVALAMIVSIQGDSIKNSTEFVNLTYTVRARLDETTAIPQDEKDRDLPDLDGTISVFILTDKA